MRRTDKERGRGRVHGGLGGGVEEEDQNLMGTVPLKASSARERRLFLTCMVMMRTSRAYGSSGVDSDFLWLCSLVTCIHFPLNSEC